MADDWNPDTGGRPLAEILREAGIESATRASRRKRWDDPDEAGLRQRRAEAAADTSASTGYGRRRSDLESPEQPRERAPREPRGRPEAGGLPDARNRREPGPLHETRPPQTPRDLRGPREARRIAPDPSTAAIPGLRPDRKPGVPGGAPPERTGTDRRATDRRETDRRAVERRSAERTPQRSRAEQHPSTGPIPVVRGDDIEATDLDNSPQESALAWLRFAGELVIALAVGVGVYFAATVLWENIPYLAVLLVPVAVTGLVTGVGAWRARMGREPVTARLLAVLVLAGTLLTIVPAASVIANR